MNIKIIHKNNVDLLKLDQKQIQEVLFVKKHKYVTKKKDEIVIRKIEWQIILIIKFLTNYEQKKLVQIKIEEMFYIIRRIIKKNILKSKKENIKLK